MADAFDHEPPTSPESPAALRFRSRPSGTFELADPAELKRLTDVLTEAKIRTLQEQVAELRAEVATLRSEIARPRLARVALEQVDASAHDPRREP